jgi:AraC-like DNA-binding protein
MKKPKPLAERLTKTILKQLYERKVTNLQIAERLGVSETYLSRTVASIQGKKPGETAPRRTAASKIFNARLETRRTLAKRVVKGQLTTEKAAAQANCSLRTMQRYVASYTQ